MLEKLIPAALEGYNWLAAVATIADLPVAAEENDTCVVAATGIPRTFLAGKWEEWPAFTPTRPAPAAQLERKKFDSLLRAYTNAVHNHRTGIKSSRAQGLKYLQMAAYDELLEFVIPGTGDLIPEPKTLMQVFDEAGLLDDSPDVWPDLREGSGCGGTD